MDRIGLGRGGLRSDLGVVGMMDEVRVEPAKTRTVLCSRPMMLVWSGEEGPWSPSLMLAGGGGARMGETGSEGGVRSVAHRVGSIASSASHSSSRAVLFPHVSGSKGEGQGGLQVKRRRVPSVGGAVLRMVAVVLP